MRTLALPHELVRRKIVTALNASAPIGPDPAEGLLAWLPRFARLCSMSCAPMCAAVMIGLERRIQCDGHAEWVQRSWCPNECAGGDETVREWIQSLVSEPI